MKHNLKMISENGQSSTGFVDVFKTTFESKKAYVIINYLPLFADKTPKVVATLLLEGEKSHWTEGTVKSILYECEERIKNVSNLKFNIVNKPEYMTIQTFFIKEFSSLEFGTCGDFNFDKPIN